MAAVKTTLHTEPRGGGEPLEEIPGEIIKYGERLNRPGPFSFGLAIDHPTCRRTVLNPGVHELVVTRNGARVWAGPLLTATERDSQNMQFGGEGLLHWTHRMHVTTDLVYSSIDQFTIARALVAHHQAKGGGDFGLDTSAVTTSGVTRDRTYYGFENKNIGEALEQLADVDAGFDMDVNPDDRELRLYYPQRGSRKPDLVIDERSIRSFHRTIDGTRQASQVLGVGSGEGDEMIRTSLQDSSAVATYGLTQDIYTNKDVSALGTLTDHIRRELSLFKKPAEMIGVTIDTDEPEVFSYLVGDELRLRFPSPYEDVDRFMKLVGRDLIFNDGEEQAVLYLEEIST